MPLVMMLSSNIRLRIISTDLVDEINFCVFYVSSTMGLTPCYKTESFLQSLTLKKLKLQLMTIKTDSGRFKLLFVILAVPFPSAAPGT